MTEALVCQLEGKRNYCRCRFVEISGNVRH